MTHNEYAEGLRQIATFLEQHQEIDLPEETISAYSLYSKEKAAKVARALGHGGRCDKVFADTLVTLKRDFNGITLQYHGSRSNVCQQVAVGKKVVPEQYIAPRPATEGHIVPEHEETVYEWRCEPLLGKPDMETLEEPVMLTDGGTPILEAEYVDIPF